MRKRRGRVEREKERERESEGGNKEKDKYKRFWIVVHRFFLVHMIVQEIFYTREKNIAY